MPVNLDKLFGTFPAAAWFIPRSKADEARFQHRNWELARTLGMKPRPDEGLIDAWYCTMHEENGLPSQPPVHPAIKEAIDSAPKSLHSFLTIIRGGPPMGKPPGMTSKPQAVHTSEQGRSHRRRRPVPPSRTSER